MLSSTLPLPLSSSKSLSAYFGMCSFPPISDKPHSQWSFNMNISYNMPEILGNCGVRKMTYSSCCQPNTQILFWRAALQHLVPLYMCIQDCPVPGTESGTCLFTFHMVGDCTVLFSSLMDQNF